MWPSPAPRYVNLSMHELESGLQIAGYTCPEYCSLVTNCGECGLEDACTWCASSSTCLAKTDTAGCNDPTASGSCCAECAVHTNCSSCSSEPGCGWCFDSGTCLSGKAGEWCDECEAYIEYDDDNVKTSPCDVCEGAVGANGTRVDAQLEAVANFCAGHGTCDMSYHSGECVGSDCHTSSCSCDSGYWG